MKSRWLKISVILLALVLQASCELRPLSDLNKNLLLRLRINLQIRNVQTPPNVEVMRVIFYDPITNRRFTEDYVTSEGGYISVPPGYYKLVVYNFDTESTMIRRDADLYYMEAYTNEISQQVRDKALSIIRRTRAEIESAKSGRGTKSETNGADTYDVERVDSITKEDEDWAASMDGIENTKIVYEPDHLFVARQDVTIYDDRDEQVIETAAETIVETFYLSVRIKNIKNIASANALLTGQIGSNFIAYPKDEGKSDDNVSLYFPLNEGKDSLNNDIMYTTFNTFGKLTNEESRLWLTIFLTTHTGQTIEWHSDITEDFVENNDYRIVLEDEIPIPEPESTGGGGGGFQPGVAEWEEEHYYIDL